MIKRIYFLMLVLVLTSFGWRNAENSSDCFPDKGIKIAEIHAKIESKKDSSENISFILAEVIHFDTKGRPTLREYPFNGEKTITVYKNDKPQYVIEYILDLPPIYTQNEKDAAIAKSKYRSDTGYVVKHHTDGRPMKITGIDSMSWLYEYNGCNTETQTFLKENGDTVQKVQLTYREGLLMKINNIGITPTVYNLTRRYYEYELNKYGDWIKRSRNYGDDQKIIEKRVLTYY